MREPTPQRGRFHWFAYHAPPRNTRLGDSSKKGPYPAADCLHELRDAATLADLTPLLLRCGWQPGEFLFNLPDNVMQGATKPPSLQPGDLVVLVTRPPISDDGRKRRIERSGTALEGHVLQTLQERFFPTCDRGEVHLVDSLRTILARAPGKLAAYGEIAFQEQRSARGTLGCYAEWWVDRQLRSQRQVPLADPNPLYRRSAGYLAYAPRVPALGHAGLLVLFGISGLNTLCWGRFLTHPRHLLARILEDILTNRQDRAENHLLVAEWEHPPPGAVPASTEFLSTYRPVLLFHAASTAGGWQIRSTANPKE